MLCVLYFASEDFFCSVVALQKHSCTLSSGVLDWIRLPPDDSLLIGYEVKLALHYEAD